MFKNWPQWIIDRLHLCPRCQRQKARAAEQRRYVREAKRLYRQMRDTGAIDIFGNVVPKKEEDNG